MLNYPGVFGALQKSILHAFTVEEMPYTILKILNLSCGSENIGHTLKRHFTNTRLDLFGRDFRESDRIPKDCCVLEKRDFCFARLRLAHVTTVQAVDVPSFHY